jgi:hypothetical protein
MMDYITAMQMEEEEKRWETEEMILRMADIVYENRRLRRELNEALEYKQKYHDLVDRNFKQAQEGTANLLNAIMNGAFAKRED